MLLGAALAGGGGYLTWLYRTLTPQLFPPDPRHAPWLLIAGLAGLIAGIVLLIEALMPRPQRKAQIAQDAERRRAAIAAADVYYAERARAADRDWRSGDLPPQPPKPSPFDNAPFEKGPVETAPVAEATLAPAASAVAPLGAPVFAATPSLALDSHFPSMASLGAIPPSVDGPLLPRPTSAAALSTAYSPTPATRAPLSPSANAPTRPALVFDAAAQPAYAATPSLINGAFTRIRAALAGGELEAADQLLAEERTRLTTGGANSETDLAELTGLAGDHAAASGRIGGAKWLWRLSLQRFGAANAMGAPAARAVSERLRLADQ